MTPCKGGSAVWQASSGYGSRRETKVPHQGDAGLLGQYPYARVILWGPQILAENLPEPARHI